MITVDYNEKSKNLTYLYTSPWTNKFNYELFEFGPELPDIDYNSEAAELLRAHRVNVKDRLREILKKRAFSSIITVEDQHVYNLYKSPWDHEEWYPSHPSNTWIDYFDTYKLTDDEWIDNIYFENTDSGEIKVTNVHVDRFDPTLISLNFGTYKDIHEWKYAAKMKEPRRSIYDILKSPRMSKTLLELANNEYSYLWDPSECMILGNTFFCDEYFFLTPGLFSDIIEARVIDEEAVIFLDKRTWKK